MDPAIIVGLGNPGAAYEQTRHNVGFYVLDAFAARQNATFAIEGRINSALARTNLAGRTAWLVKPFSYMNESGSCLERLFRFYKFPTENLLVIHDDITLAPGTEKLSVGGGDGGHNGITSILRHLPNTFARYRVGIGGKHWPGQDLADHVLGKLTNEEQTILTNRITSHIHGLEIWLAQGTAIAQNLINKKPPQ